MSRPVGSSPRDVNCVVCSAVFVAYRGGAMYCSKNCNMRAFGKRHSKRLAAEKKAQRAANPEPARARDRAYHAEHRTERNIKSREWALEHPGYATESVRRWRAKNPEKARANDRRRQIEHRDEVNAYNRAYAKAHPELARHRVRRRRVLKQNAEGSFTDQEWLEKCELFAWCCAYCGEEKTLEWDHMIPLSRGGSDYISNIVPACDSCNSSKRNKTAKEFLEWRARR